MSGSPSRDGMTTSADSNLGGLRVCAQGRVTSRFANGNTRLSAWSRKDWLYCSTGTRTQSCTGALDSRTRDSRTAAADTRKDDARSGAKDRKFALRFRHSEFTY